MAKKIRFPLEMEQGVEVRSMEELRENFSLARVLVYVSNGKLLTWLRDRYVDDIADVIEELNIDDTELPKKICEIFDIEYDEQVADNLEKAEERNRKLNVIKRYTTDQRFFDAVDVVALTQDDVYDLLDEEKVMIYLCGENFSIPLSKEGITYVGINNPTVVVASKEEVDWKEKDITLINVEFDEKYKKILDSEEKEEEAKAEKLYLSGRLDEAFEIFKMVAEKGNARAMYFIGEYYTSGYGHIVKDLEEGAKWRKKGAERGDILASLNMAYTFHKNSTERNDIFNKMFKPTFDLAENGNIIAQNELAELYFGGYGTNVNESEGIKWLRKSAEAGYWRSADKIGDLYYFGNHVPQSYSEAMKYYRMGTESEYANSELNMAYCYYYGKGVAEDNNKALEWFKKSYEHGSGEAANMIGIMYFNGHGVPIDNAQEFFWIKKSAEMGYTQGQNNLGNCYYAGRGTEKNYEMAKQWYMKAANSGNDSAATQIGIIEIDKENYTEAVVWFKKAAENGYADAQNKLGVRYENGQGVEQNTDIALYWYLKAAAQNHEKAIENIKERFSIGENDEFLAAMNGKIIYCAKRTESWFKQISYIYAAEKPGQEKLLYTDSCETNFATEVKCVHNDRIAVVTICNIETSTVIKIDDDKVNVIEQWSHEASESNYASIHENQLEYGTINSIGMSQCRNTINLE